jgi:hypothetical protein
MSILETVGWSIQYKSIGAVMDWHVGPKTFSVPKGVFFLLSFEFLRGLENKSPIAQKIVRIMHYAGIHKNKFIGLIFPPVQAPPNVFLLNNFRPLFNTLGFNVSPTLDGQQNARLFVINSFLTTPPEARPLAYHTTLSSPHNGRQFFTGETEYAIKQAAPDLKLLPIEQAYTDKIKVTLPYGIYWYNHQKDSHLLLASTTLFSFSGITESCHICPMDPEIKKEMHQGILATMWEASLLARYHGDYKKLPHTPVPPLPQELCALGTPLPKQETQNTPLRKNAWMEINIFNSHDPTKQGQQDHLIEYIVKSELDSLWISLNPNMYYSPIAKNSRKEQERELIDQVSCFTQKLTRASTEAHTPIPKILVGFEIANNLYAPHLPKPCAQDLYGNCYGDVPAPLDRTFWTNEIKQPLELFLNIWKRPEVSRGIPISGVVIDLEMYCRKTSGTFLPTMGFETETFKSFIDQQHLECKPMPTHDMVNFFMSKQLSQKYFTFLEQEAEKLGRDLRYYFDTKIPHSIVICYTPTILVHWFYKGLNKGLSSITNPLYLFTFNTEFYNHKPWFARNKINVKHSSVLLLSKLQSDKDFPMIDNILAHHNGIWFNRFSRMAEPKVSDWTAIERPQLPESNYQDFISYTAKKH